MNLKIGDKVKTKLQPMTCGLWNYPKETKETIKPPSYYHTWEVVEIESDLITLKDNKQNIMQVDKDGHGIDDYINHLIYKIIKK